MMTSSKNYLVFKNYTIEDQTKWYNDRSLETDLTDNYKAMEKIATESAMKNLQNVDAIRVFRGTANDIREVFRKNFYEIYELWKEGNNILYCDLDVVFMNPVDVFGTFDNKFRMFNLTDPMTTTDEHYGVSFPHYFNCGIRYYPKDMSQEVWDLGIEMVENWNPDRWDSEQIIYNAMMFLQDESAQEFYHPYYAYQCLHNPIHQNGQLLNRQFNNIDINQALMIHVHGSRGSADRARLMQRLLDRDFAAVEETLLL